MCIKSRIVVNNPLKRNAYIIRKRNRFFIFRNGVFDSGSFTRYKSCYLKIIAAVKIFFILSSYKNSGSTRRSILLRTFCAAFFYGSLKSYGE